MSGVRPTPRQDPDERRYWDFAARRELRLQVCMACDHPRYPPGPVCPACGSPESDWRPMSGRGRIVAWTTFHRTYFAGLPAPYTVVSVETDEGPLLVGNFVDAAGPPVIGAEVACVFQPATFEHNAEGLVCQWRPIHHKHPSEQGG